MFDILEGIVEHIMLFFNMPDRPFITAFIKWVLLTTIFFTVVRLFRLFQSLGSAYLIDDIRLCVVLGFCAALLSFLLNAMD